MKAVLDACVLYPTVLRQILIGAAEAGWITPIWSSRLMEEWARTAARQGGTGEEVVARGEIALLSARFPGAMTKADPAQEAALWLPDPGDIHVLATAITADAEAIITLNLKDFPRRELAAFDMTAQHPDALLFDLWQAHPVALAEIAGRAHAAAQQAAGQVLSQRALLKRARLPRLAKALAG